MIFVNFKTYEQGTGEKGLELIKILEGVAQEKQIRIIPVVQALDIKEASEGSTLEIWAQHVDPDNFGAHTGEIIPEAVKEDGATGTFLNHSEHKFQEFERLEKAQKRSSEVGLKTLIFAGDMKELEKILTLKPTYASYEPPELVGSKTTSVAEAKPEVIARAYELCQKARTPLIVGAGIKSIEDVRTSIKLGAVGVAVASDIVKSDNPEKEVLELAEGFF